MHKLTNCRNGCLYSQQKYRVWHIIASHQDGICIHTLVEWSSLPRRDVENLVEDLYVEGNVYFQKRTGRWYPEMLPIH